ncbi:hypothetical protein E3N88_19543 [Mikania micrantha]|uniref:non-specific serine/threonine protein kinase n=1 Tax=Mikania micrantha TaxID=192012 RepID=A0A5N6NRK2_9ASTR|nr:hypothetical protein E3N88_19543 [Mikania micrantha]
MALFRTFSSVSILQAVLTLAMVHAQDDQSGFISIDCGIAEGSTYTDEKTGINYVSDAGFIDSGKNQAISSNTLDFQFRTLRSFPENTRNCYTLKPKQGKGNRYLIRTRFMYGNYDFKSQTPEFDLYLGNDHWSRVRVGSFATDYEIIHLTSSNYIYVCLVNIGLGNPFISALELRLLDNTMYADGLRSLNLFHRYNYGASEIVRYADDKYDRIWDPAANLPNLTNIQTSSPVSLGSPTKEKVPSKVMSTAVKTLTTSFYFYKKWGPTNETDEFLIYVHFAEIETLKINETREFNIYINNVYRAGPLSPLDHTTSTYFFRANAATSYELDVYSTQNSTLPPIINAIEVYKAIRLQQQQTEDQDATTMWSIKSTYGLKRNWQGDPCVPRDSVWDGINCSNNAADNLGIISMNLSFSGLSGEIAPALANLTMIQSLDLSNNNLTGTVPKFLASLDSLKILKLEGNNFTGPLPAELLEKAKKGLSMRSVFLLIFLGSRKKETCQHIEGYQHVSNNDTRKKVVIAATTSAIFVLLAILAVLWIIKRRQTQEDFIGPTNHRYTYSEVQKITDNFSNVIGKGGFGTVFSGLIGDTRAAVKMLSESSAQGYKEFQAEVSLLMSVHHKNITSLVGYCDEGSHKGIIYEYMANGNLRTHLFDGSRNVLSWKKRLLIGYDAAQGLEYMHHGCTPPIVHRDVKCSNILLNENLQAKLADFGLSKAFANEDVTHVSTTIAGTPGYLDPEYYITNRLTEKSDVYSFGAVLLELITGRPAISTNISVIHWVKSMVEKGSVENIIDPRLQGDFEFNTAWKVVELALTCADSSSVKRPTMRDVVMDLKNCLEGAKPNNLNQNMVFILFFHFFAGFLSIDCGIVEGSTYTDDTTGINYVSDAGFIDSGKNQEILSAYKSNTLDFQLRTLRSFSENTRNCYTLKPKQGKGNRYLIRARFMYGNYDFKNQIPEFDLYLGNDHWSRVRVGSFAIDNEIIHLASSNYIYVCLVNIGLGNPFISALELRLLDNTMYADDLRSLNLFQRKNYGALEIVRSVFKYLAKLLMYPSIRDEFIVPRNQRFTYSEVQRITDSFSNVIGKGGFGTVFSGLIGDTRAAVKMLSESSAQGYKEFQAEVSLLMSVHHKNITSLVGYCDEGSHKGIIYEYMANGNLRTHLFDGSRNVLSWKKRLQIGYDAAQGLEYMHHGCTPPIVHRDVKCSNILLNENLQAKLADFGLSKAFANEDVTHVSTTIAGTQYYITNRLTEKSDVYSFGVVVLELITGRPAISTNISVIHWVKSMVEKGSVENIIDPRLQGDFEFNTAWKVVELAVTCVDSSSVKRPTMRDVVMDLKNCLEGAKPNNLNQNMSLNLENNMTPISIQSYDISDDDDDFVRPPKRQKQTSKPVDQTNEDIRPQFVDYMDKKLKGMVGVVNLKDSVTGLSKQQKKAIIDMGFKPFLSIVVDTIPTRLKDGNGEDGSDDDVHVVIESSVDGDEGDGVEGDCDGDESDGDEADVDGDEDGHTNDSAVNEDVDVDHGNSPLSLSIGITQEEVYVQQSSPNVPITSSYSVIMNGYADPSIRDEFIVPRNQRFTYSEVQRITDSFSNVIGKGGFGTVFSGLIGDTGAAVKMLSESSAQGYKEFQAEVSLLMSVHHKNITSLVGYCDEGSHKGIIYEYMANGNLRTHLFVSWIRITGLEYMHHGCTPPIVHRDVKCSNILLNENMQAKLADFGLSKAFANEDATHVSTIIAGTPGYLDPEYYTTNRLTEKSDVYSFGVVLLELITGRPAISTNIYVVHWVKSMVEKGSVENIIDPRLQGDFEVNTAWKVVELAMTCVDSSSVKRPTMKDVVMELKNCLDGAKPNNLDQNMSLSFESIGGPNLR